jgi:hypothetical protein
LLAKTAASGAPSFPRPITDTFMNSFSMLGTILGEPKR